MSARCDRRTLLGSWWPSWRPGPAWAGWGRASACLRCQPSLAEEDAHSAEKQLEKLKLVLPKLSPSKGATLVPPFGWARPSMCRGHLPTKEGKIVVGKVGKDVTLAEANEAARLVGLTILAVVRAELGSLDKVVRLVKTLGMVNCTPEFTQQPEVINGFSDLMVEVFGAKAGKGARSAVGMSSLPRGAGSGGGSDFQVKGG